MMKRLLDNLKSTVCIVMFALLCSFSTTLFAYELLPHTANYTAKIKKGVSINGKATRSLTKTEDGKWLYSFKVKSFAADIDESVLFSLFDDLVKPASYNYKLSPFFGRDRRRSVQFNWKNNSASSSLKKTQWELPNLPTNTYDRLSYQMQLLIDVSQKSLPSTYNIAHKGRIKPSNFDLLETVKIDTNIGSAQAYLVKKIRDKASKRETHLWFSVAQPFLLLKMVQKEKDGEEYEINITKASIDGTEISFKTIDNGLQ